MTKPDARRIADEHGLKQLTAKHIDEFARVLENGQKLAARLPKDLHWTEEPAHTYKLAPTTTAMPVMPEAGGKS